MDNIYELKNYTMQIKLTNQTTKKINNITIITYKYLINNNYNFETYKIYKNNKFSHKAYNDDNYNILLNNNIKLTNKQIIKLIK